MICSCLTFFLSHEYFREENEKQPVCSSK